MILFSDLGQAVANLRAQKTRTLLTALGIVFGVGSVIGMLMLGFLANPEVNPAIANTFKANGVAVLLAGGWHQFVNQFIGVAFTAALGAAGTFLIVKLVAAVIGLRVDQEDESVGLDLSQHGERAYNE